MYLFGGASPIDKAIYSAVLKSKYLNNLYIADGDGYFKEKSCTLDSNGYKLILEAKEKKIDIIISNWGANDSGIINAFNLAGIKGIGVDEYWAQLESSKEFGKQFMQRNFIQYPQYKVFTNIDEAQEYISMQRFPVVIKADGYSRGIGTFICKDKESAISAAKKILNKEK